MNSKEMYQKVQVQLARTEKYNLMYKFKNKKYLVYINKM